VSHSGNLNSGDGSLRAVFPRGAATNGDASTESLYVVGDGCINEDSDNDFEAEFGVSGTFTFRIDSPPQPFS
jgi:hypothetical protein